MTYTPRKLDGRRIVITCYMADLRLVLAVEVAPGRHPSRIYSSTSVFR
jgi:hypothetical protein